MRISQYRPYLLPIVLGFLGLILLIRIIILGNIVLLPEQVDIVMLVLFLSVAIITSIHSLVRISLNYLRLIHIKKARRETLAEHRRFLKRLDHELKNPLTAIHAGLQSLVLTEITDQQRHLIETMQNETIRLGRLVTDLRKLGALEIQTLNRTPVNIENWVRNITRLEQDRFEIQHRKFSTTVNATNPIGYFDEDLLSLAIHNLIDNALKYTSTNDSIWVDVQSNQDLLITITDTGIGIPEDALPFIWEELYRAEQSEKISGSGIGLALVRAIVELHAGSVSVTSDPEHGTSITLRLPSVHQIEKRYFKT